jgi:hypothetical protein
MTDALRPKHERRTARATHVEIKAAGYTGPRGGRHHPGSIRPPGHFQAGAIEEVLALMRLSVGTAWVQSLSSSTAQLQSGVGYTS